MRAITKMGQNEDKNDSRNDESKLFGAILHDKLNFVADSVSHVTLEQLGAFGALICSLLLSSCFVLGNAKPFLVATDWIIWPLYQLILRIVGTTIGLGLGLGLACSVYDQLDAWRTENESGRRGIDLPVVKMKQTSRHLQFSGEHGTSSTNGSSSKKYSTFRSTNSSSLSLNNGVFLEDEKSYVSLMKSAGYSLIIPPHRLQLRGQVVRGDHPLFHNRAYNFTKTIMKADDTESKTGTNTDKRQAQSQPPDLTAQRSKAVMSMCRMWPTLPDQINEELGRFIEFILRDFVAIWYSKVDYACIYQDPEKPAPQNENEHNRNTEAVQQMMLCALSEFRQVPFLDSLYESLAVIFGNLAIRVESVNVFELLLVKWLHVLTHTFKIYRQLRKNVPKLPSTKQQLQTEQNATDMSSSPLNEMATSRMSFRGFNLRQSTRGDFEALSTLSEENLDPGYQNKKQTTNPPVSEMSMTREFLVAGKLHKAVTFGLDVSSLLASDLNDIPEQNVKSTSSKMTDDEVLEKRLFATKLIRECEIDYNRVLGHRMVRALIPRTDYSSAIVRTLLTEMMGGCVLTPIMGIFCPEYLNYWIIKGLAPPDTPLDSEIKVEKIAEQTTGVVSSVSVEPVDKPVEGISPSSTQRTIVPEQSQVSETLKNEDRDMTEHQRSALDVEVETSNQTETAFSNVASPIAESATLLHSKLTTADNQELSQSQAFNSFVSIDTIFNQLAQALIDLQTFVDFEEFRNARMNNVEHHVQWENPSCKSAVIRLVLVIEAALFHGRCTYKQQKFKSDIDSKSDLDSDDDFDVASVDGEVVDSFNGQEKPVMSTIEGSPVEVTLGEYESISFSEILMELTSDMDAFEERIEANANSERVEKTNKQCEPLISEMYEPTPQEQSTMRTLIAAWLHSGQVYRAISVLIKAQTSILAPLYQEKALLRLPDEANGFVRQLIALVDVNILVDTMTVLACPRLGDANQDSLLDFTREKREVQYRANGTTSVSTAAKAITSPERQPNAQIDREADQARSPTSINNALLASTQFMSSSSTPRYLDFHRNEAFACSLRSERERRLASWEQIMHHEIYGTEGYSEALPIVCRSSRKGVDGDDHNAVHKELHHIARIFYTGTNVIAIRDAARRQSSAGIGSNNMSYGPTDGESSDFVNDEGLQQVSLVTIDTACPRRRLEVPDDDSSFLLRAQPRPLNAVGVHRDQRNHDQSFKCFAATYEEPALPASGHYQGGKFVRRCLIRYFPIDRTASVTLHVENARKLDQRKCVNSVPDTITVGQSIIGRTAPFLSAEFLRERHLCQRWVPKGTTRTQSILASNVMEPTDFTSIPRSGKAIDFVYRMNFYERPMLDLGGKHFTACDSASLGPHRADASAMEISDATISIALILLGSDDGLAGEHAGESRPVVEMGKDGYPVMWMKFSRKDDTLVEVKPYRTSFVRAALLITAARQEAQLQCLIKCVRDGSVKQASKALTDACLKPTIKLLEYASSSNREKQSTLQRDLKLGLTHIDHSQLLRNGLLLPRYPTSILDLTATVEDVVSSSEVKGVGNMFGAAGSTVFRIRCVAIVTLIATDYELEGDQGYRSDDGSLGKIFKEEWTIYRSMKEFQTFHKHVKTEVSVAESSGNAGSRLVGAATAAFTATNSIPTRQRQKKLLIPSLSQGPKAAALGVTRKLNTKRKEFLESYLAYLLAPGHLINRSTELLLFLGAFYPFSPNAIVGRTIDSDVDPLGRSEMLRTILQKRTMESAMLQPTLNVLPKRKTDIAENTVPNNSNTIAEGSGDDGDIPDESDDFEEKGANKDMIPSIRSKIDKVQLPLVRNRIFELLRHQFGFDNASFLRNRVLQALKTASFAVTSPAEFRRMLYKLHLEHLSADAIAYWIKYGTDTLWPEGVFFTSSPPTPLDELKLQMNRAKEVLHAGIPSEFRAILGQELTRDGIDTLHEMLQNRLVVKSMAYMMFDLLWLEVYPELGDVISGGEALDMES